MDVLSDILRTVDLCGTVYFHANFRSPWGMEIPHGSYANFHIVTEGSAWVKGPGHSSGAALEAGQMVVFPHGDAHRLMDSRQTNPVPAAEFLGSPAAKSDPPTYGGQGRLSKMICGHFEYSRSLMHPLFVALPPMIKVAAKDSLMSEWITTATRLAAMESERGGPGSAAVVDRLAEALLVQILRLHSGSSLGASFVDALRDPGLLPAIRAVHDHPAGRWTVESMAQLCNKSRSAFASAFSQAVGMSPMAYVTHWRMQRARHLLQATEASMARIAADVGYESEWAFAKAFKRAFSATPATFRRRSTAP